MRLLLQFGALGAFIFLMLGTVMALIGAPMTRDYIISRNLYDQMIGNSLFYPVLESLMPWGYLVAFVVFIVLLWYLVAAVLNPVFSRFPFNPHGKSFRAWLTWLIGGATFTILITAISSPNPIGNYSDLKIYEWLLLFGIGAVPWVVVSSQGFGQLDRKLTANLHWANILRAAGLGMLFTVLLIMVDKAITFGFNAWLVLLTESLFRSGELTAKGYIWSWIGMMVMGGIAFAITFGLLPIFRPGAGGLRGRLTASRPALGLLAIAVVAGLLVTPLLYNIHLLGDRTVAGVTNVDEIEPLSLRQIRLCTAEECLCNTNESSTPRLAVEEYNKQVSGMGFLMPGGEVPLHPDIIPVLEEFLREHEHSVLRRSAMSDVIEVHRQLWQPFESHRAMEWFVQEHHFESEPIIWTLLRVAWLTRSAPINEETRRMLSTLSDEKKYFIGDHSAIKLADAWARFGNEQQMNRFLEKARQAYPEEYQDLDLQSESFTIGEISGRLVMPGNVSDIRVGLFRMPDTPLQQAKERQSDKPEKDNRVSFGTYWTKVTSSTILSSDGEFRFTDLGSGDYYLALLVPRNKLNGAEKVAGHNIPDAISLNAENPVHNVGEIRLMPE